MDHKDKEKKWITQDRWELLMKGKNPNCKCGHSVQGNKEELNQQYASLDKKVKKNCKKDKKAFIEKKGTEEEQAAKKMILRCYSKLSKN